MSSIGNADVNRRLGELGIELSAAPDPVANYVSVQYAGDLLFLSGAGPFRDGKPAVKGRLGDDMSIEEGYQAARLTGINLLALLNRELKGIRPVYSGFRTAARGHQRCFRPYR